MKIGFLTDNYPCSGGAAGIGTYTQLVAEHLAGAGHETHVFTGAPGAKRRARTVNGVRLWECPAWPKRRFMPPLNAVEFTLRWRSDAELLHRYSLLVSVREAARRHPFDLIETPEIGALGGLVKRGVHTRRLAVRLHSPSNCRPDCEGTQSSMPWTRINEAERALALHADVVTAPTETARKQIERFWNAPLNHAAVIGNPVKAIACKEEEEATGPRSGVFFGRLEPRKGVDTLAAAIGRVRARFPEFQMNFIGDDRPWGGGRGNASDIIRDIAAQTGGAGGFRILPPMRHAELAEAVRRSSVCVLPSRWETFGLSFLEAMMWGAPCVVSDLGCFRELAEEGKHCLFAEPGNPEEFAGRICAILGNPSLARRLARQAHTHALDWATEKIVPQLLNAWLSK